VGVLIYCYFMLSEVSRGAALYISGLWQFIFILAVNFVMNKTRTADAGFRFRLLVLQARFHCNWGLFCSLLIQPSFLVDDFSLGIVFLCKGLCCWHTTKLKKSTYICNKRLNYSSVPNIPYLYSVSQKLLPWLSRPYLVFLNIFIYCWICSCPEYSWHISHWMLNNQQSILLTHAYPK
jgi:hypothetical protein